MHVFLFLNLTSNILPLTIFKNAKYIIAIGTIYKYIFETQVQIDKMRKDALVTCLGKTTVRNHGFVSSLLVLNYQM